MVEAEVKCSLTHQGIPIIFWKQIEGAFSRACEMFSAVNILICWPDRAIALACVQLRLATGCVGLAVLISSRALSLNYSYNYSIYRGYRKYALQGAFSAYCKAINKTSPYT